MVTEVLARHQAVPSADEPVDTACPEIEFPPGEVRDDDGDGAFETRKCLPVVHVGMPDIASGMGVGLPDQP